MLFDPYKNFKNRAVMAPMTRARNADGIPNENNARYYSQRTGAGLIVTEGTAISNTSMGFLHIPGLYTAEQVDGWKLVTKAVHEKGSRIFTQLWHVGRISHTSIQPNGQLPPGASNIKAAHSFAYGLDENGKESFVPASQPRALTIAEVKQVVRDFANAARNAIAAGFDGVELHGANGYLIEQFLNPHVNNRTDEYGGSMENRSRFLLEAIDACIGETGADKVAIRLTPYGDMHELPHYPEIEATYEYLAAELARRNIAFIHLMDQKSRGAFALPQEFLKRFRNWYTGTLILAGGMDKARSEELINAGLIDMAAFGEPFIANPDLVERMQNNWPLTPANRNLHYVLGNHGYTDWKTYEEQQNEK